MRVNRRRGQILTVMVSVAAVASFGSVVWWAHNQDVKAGGKGLEPLVVQAPTTPARVKPENAGGLVPPNQDKEVFNRISPGAVPAQPEKLLPMAVTPKLPPNGLPLPAAPPRETEAGKTPTPLQPASTAAGTPPPAGAEPKVPANPPNVQPATNTPATTESGPSIASLIENMSGPTGGWRIQVASVKNEDVAKSTWARLQSAHGERAGEPAHAGGPGRSRRSWRLVPRAGRTARREAGPFGLCLAEGPQGRLRLGPARPLGLCA